MTPDERELRRALEARSGPPTPAFRARLSAALAEGRPAGDPRPALAIVAAVVFAAAIVAVFVLSRHGTEPASSPAGAGPAPVATPSPTSSTTPSPSSTIAPRPTILTSPITLPNIAQFDAPSHSVVWAFVGGVELFRSTDRGDTWQQRPLPSGAGSMDGISFVDDRLGWLMTSAPPATQCQAQVAAIWQTSDAGDTWQPLDASGMADGKCKTGLSFIDPMHGFLAAWDPNHAPVIYRTADGGRTWTASHPLPDPPGFSWQSGGSNAVPGRVHAFGSTLLVAAGGYAFRSTDGGGTWSYVARTPNGASSIAFVTAGRWLELIAPGQTEETLDGGVTWHAYASGYTQAAPIAPDVIFGDPEVGYATVRGGLSRTLDGGLHWTYLRTPGTST